MKLLKSLDKAEKIAEFVAYSTGWQDIGYQWISGQINYAEFLTERELLEEVAERLLDQPFVKRELCNFCQNERVFTLLNEDGHSISVDCPSCSPRPKTAVDAKANLENSIRVFEQKIKERT